MFISSSFIHHKSKLTSLLLTHTHLIVCFYQVFIFRTLYSCLTAYILTKHEGAPGMCKQFFDMYILLLFARLYYFKSLTLPLETYMSSYFVTLEMHTGHVQFFRKLQYSLCGFHLHSILTIRVKTTVQCSHNFTFLVAFSNYLQYV